MVTLACMTLGSEVRRRRLALGLTLDDLSERAGLSPHYLSTLERDRRDPHVSTLLAVAKALRVKPADLLGDADAERPTAGALYERAPAEAQEAMATLLRLIVASRGKPKKKRAR
jgi:transcriptional regulator with XRE-family HTH domain